MSKVAIIGVGPGAPDLLPLRSLELLKRAKVVCGFTTVLKPIQGYLSPEVRQINLTYKNQVACLEEAARWAAGGLETVFCAWGDFNFSGKELVERVKQAGLPYNLEYELIPGISSLQIACARAGLAMEESLFITLHRRGGLEAAEAELALALRRGERNLLVLPHTFDLMPAALAAFLIQEGEDPARPVTVFERLTHPAEAEHHLNLAELAADQHEFSDLSIVVLPLWEARN